MIMTLREMEELIKKQDQKWLKVGEYEFLYEKTTGEKILNEQIKSIDSNDDNKELKLLIAVLIDSIIDWKNVKFKDIVDNTDGLKLEDLEQEVPFKKEWLNKKLFSKYPNLIIELMNSARDSNSKAVEAEVEKKKE